MRIVEWEGIERSQWDDLCDMSSEAWLFHRYEWIEIESRYFSEGNISFGIEGGDGVLLGLQPLYVRSLGLGRFSEKLLDCGVHRHTGLAVRDTLRESEIKSIRKLTIKEIFRLSEQRQADRIQLNCQNLAPEHRRNCREEIPFWVADFNFQLGLNFGEAGIVPVPGMSTCCADQIVFLEDKNEDQLFGKLESSCQRAIRKALKSELVAIVKDNSVGVHEYYELAKKSARRTGESLPPQEYYADVYEALSNSAKCKLLFALHQGKNAGALFLLMDKQAVHFMGGVSDPEFLPMRVNDFLHWSAMLWAKENGYFYYRLGPVFPEVPNDWLISKVSRFKKKFGGQSIPIIQGSFFCQPEKYVSLGEEAVHLACSSIAKAPSLVSSDRIVEGDLRLAVRHRDAKAIEKILQTYGLSVLPARICTVREAANAALSVIMICPGNLPEGVDLRFGVKNDKRLYYNSKSHGFWGRKRPIYQALLPHVTFAGDNVEPIWVDQEGESVIAWWNHPGGKSLLVGMDLVEETVRYRQGDPGKVDEVDTKSKFEFDFERPNYLFEEHLVPQHLSEPWIDNLGYFLAEEISRLAGIPLIEPLPGGAKGAIIVTGDDDQAYLEKYSRQLDIFKGLPITYFLVPQTRHTKETLDALGNHVQIGLHPDALEAPENYDRLCAEQARQIRDLSGRSVRTVRNHGFLNRGYLGHLEAWEENDLKLDVNCPGIDGTALTGSFLPMHVRRQDGTWSDHYSLLTLFGDGMVYALKMTRGQAVRRIREIVKQIENRHPGVVVCNFHPQNIDHTVRIHKVVRDVARRPGWIALGLEDYLDWLEVLENITVTKVGKSFLLRSPKLVQDLVLRFSDSDGWRTMRLESWKDQRKIHFN